MAVEDVIYLSDRAAWRAWLARHHARSRGVWFTFYRKASGKPSLPYEAAIEEALCYGWIDSTIRKIDDERYCLQFTPRRDPANWSIPNRRRLAKLMAAKRMTPAGLAVVDPSVLTAPAPPLAQRGADVAVPLDLRAALTACDAARAAFDAWAPTYRRQYVDWVAAAKRPETRARRVGQVVERAAAGRKFGTK